MENSYDGGIYMWTCTKSGRSYIGRTQNLNRRKKEFLWFGHERYSGNAINRARKKYNKKEYWSYTILERCDEEKLSEREKFYVEKYETHHNGYNESDGGDGNCGYHPSEETKRKIGEYGRTHKLNEESRKKLSMSLKGHGFTDETKEKISQTLKKYFETNNNPNYGKRGKECKWARKIGQFDKETGRLLKVWYGTLEIIRENPTYKSSVIVNVCRCRKKSAYGFIWKYLDDKTKN
jgi:group I intron endonuclease